MTAGRTSAEAVHALQEDREFVINGAFARFP
jgi:hypothetical protein